uniref:Uncharacterized protein n=1 Tax=Triticum urartu TaxID=4572 RepID=A0A8R7UW54_TRIUA
MDGTIVVASAFCGHQEGTNYHFLSLVLTHHTTWQGISDHRRALCYICFSNVEAIITLAGHSYTHCLTFSSLNFTLQFFVVR